MCERCLFQNLATSFNELLNTFIIPPKFNTTQITIIKKSLLAGRDNFAFFRGYN
jgi:hypothetical protein